MFSLQPLAIVLGVLSPVSSGARSDIAFTAIHVSYMKDSLELLLVKGVVSVCQQQLG